VVQAGNIVLAEFPLELSTAGTWTKGKAVPVIFMHRSCVLSSVVAGVFFFLLRVYFCQCKTCVWGRRSYQFWCCVGSLFLW